MTAVLREPCRQIDERREEVRDDDRHAVDVGDREDLRRRLAVERPRLRQQPFAFGRRPDVEVMHHDHAPEPDLLRDLTPGTIL
jgi:hypothetical protein